MLALIIFTFIPRQVNKQDVENLINKYSSNSNNFYKDKDKDSQTAQSNETTTVTTEPAPKPSVNLNLIHMETTSCEEYEIVQNFFHKIIRTVKRERELNQLSNPTPPVVEESVTSSKSKPKLANNSKRAKSPKQNMYNMIQDPSQSSPDKYANSLSTVVTQSPIGHSSNYISINNNINNNSNNSSNSNLNSTNSINTVGGSAVNNININPGGYSSSTINVPSAASNSPGSLNNSKDTATKKNSSKFPFLTKILNKS